MVSSLLNRLTQNQIDSPANKKRDPYTSAINIGSTIPATTSLAANETFKTGINAVI